MSAVDWGAAAVLTLTELEVAWELAGLGETPLELELPSPGTTVAERRAVADASMDALELRGLADAGRSTPWLTAMMATLARPDTSVDVRVRGRTLVGGIAARRGGTAVFAVRHRDEVAIVAIPPTRLAVAVTEVVGDLNPGRGRTVNVAAIDLDAAMSVAGADPLRAVDELVHRGLSHDEAVAYTRMCADVDRQGQVGVCVGGGRGPYVVAVHRGPSGWFGRVGRDVVTVAPVDGAGLVRRIDELVTAAGG